MKLDRRFNCIVLLITTACSAARVTEIRIDTLMPPSAQDAAGLPSPSPTLPSTPMALVTNTSVPTPTEILIEPKYAFRCPGQPFVPLADLGLDASTHLLVRPKEDRNSPELTILDRNLTPTPILDERFADKIIYFEGVSPNHQWFVFGADEKINDDTIISEEWISSIDGKTKWLAVENVSRTESFRWVSENMLVTFDQPTRDYIWHITTKLINPFESTLEPIEHIYLDGGLYAFSPDGSQVIFKDFVDWKRMWRLYDYKTDTESVIFPWMDTSAFALPFDAYVNWSSSGVSAALEERDSLLLVMNLPPESLEKHDVSYYRIPLAAPEDLPDEFYATARVIWLKPESGLISLDWFYVNNTLVERVGPVNHFIIDTSDWIFYDYCLEEISSFAASYVTKDGRCLAWNATRSGETGIIVMDFETGKRAWVSGWELLGWGEIGR